MIKRTLAAFAVGLALVASAGCAKVDDAGKAVAVATTPVGAQAIADARNTVYGLKSLYGATVQAAVAYARLPSCTPPDHPPACSSDALVIRAAAAQPKAREAIMRAEAVVLTSSPDTTVMAAAIKAAREAYDAFKVMVPAKGGA